MRIFLFFIIIILSLNACKVTQYPTSGNFAYQTNIKVIGNYDVAEKNSLEEKLKRQIDDSLIFSKVKMKTSGLLGFIKHTVKVYHNFDSNHISRSQDFFKASYVANGYFRGGTTTYAITTDSSISNRAKIITFTCHPFKNHKMDSIATLLRDTALQNLVTNIKSGTYLKKNDFYTQELLDAERRRLTAHFKNNGYLFFSKDDIKIVVDTINTALFKPAFDPFEQQLLLEKAAAFEANPTTDITILLKDTIAANKLKKYYIGKIYIQPDNIDGQKTPPNSYIFNKSKFIKQFSVDNFKNKLFENNIYLAEGDLYKEVNIEKTIVALNTLGVWQQLTVRPIEKTTRGDTIDFIINMKPASTYQREFKVEGTYNQNNNNSGVTNAVKQLYGANTYLNFKNRNFRKSAVQTNLTANFSVEFGRDTSTKQRFINTIQTGLNFQFLFPKLSLIKNWNNHPKINNTRSAINANVSYSKRLGKFSLTEFGTGYTSAFKWKHNGLDYDLQFAVPTIEVKFLKANADFKKLLDTTPSLRNIYRDGFIFSIFNGTIINNKTIKQNIAKQTSVKTYNRFNTELSLPFLRNTLKEKVFSFIKIELDKRFYFNRPKNKTWAFRIFTGVGFNYDAVNGQNKTLPFFKQYVGGGPNSLRAWGIRNVSSYSTRNSKYLNESFGDIQVELNSEYRYPLGKVIGFQIYGAPFIDMGNIWNHKPIDLLVYPTNKSKAQLLIDDIAIAVGHGFRIDFDYFLIRFDLAAKLKEPKTILGGGGIFIKENFSQIKDIKFQLGINLPF